MLALLIIAGTCFTTIPSLNAAAKFKTGDTIVITEKAGGGVFPQGVVGENYPEYDVSAMSAKNKVGTESYYAWCASYGIPTPAPGREYVLYGFKENQKTVTVNNQIICRVNPTTGHYEYYDTGLNGYIDFNWALSCIKAAEFYAKTSQLSPAWRMVVELAVRERFFPGLAEGTIDIDKTLAAFGTGVRDYLIPLCGNDELILTPGDPSGNGVENFFEKVQSVIVYAEDHPVIWTPYAEEIKVEKTAEEEYRGDDFIFFEGTVNKYGCTLNYDVTHPAYMSVTLKGNVLTVKMPRNKMVNGTRYAWSAELMLPAGLNYNMMYGVPKTVDPNNAVQNIMVYEVDNKSLSWGDRGEHTPHETADILVKKTDETGKVMSNVEFTLYNIGANNVITKVEEQFAPVQTTNTSGVVEWKGLPLGKYFLVESGKPAGYSAPQWRIQWTVKDGDSEKNTAASSVTTATYNGIEGIVIELIAGTVKASVGVINEQETSKIIIDKAVTDNSNPAGFKFTLYPVKANGTLGAGVQQTTGQPGTANFLDLPFGTYFLVENYAGTGYAPYKQEEWGISGALSAQFTTISGMNGWKIEIGKTQVWVYANNYKPDHHITIEKVDTEGNPLAGVPFEVRKFINGEEDGLALLLTDANGKVSMSNIGVGEYLIVERAHKGQAPYNPAQWVVTGAKSATYTTMDGATGWYIVLDQDHPSATIKAVNKIKTGFIGIDKTAEDGVNEFSVFKFRVTSDNSPAFDQTYTLVNNPEDNYASIGITGLPLYKANGDPITYTVEEVDVADRYNRLDPVSFTFENLINANPNNTRYVMSFAFQNTLKRKNLYIEKTSYNDIVDGITFTLTGSDGSKYEGVTVEDENGKIGRVEFLDLRVYDDNDEIITYTLKETINGSYRFSPHPIFTSEDTVLNTISFSNGKTNFNLLGGDAHISVFNTQPPFEIGITKQSDFGEREGFTFILTSSLGDRWESVTDEYGEAYFGLLDTYDSNLNPIIYTLTELETDVYKPMEPIIIDASQITNGLYVLNRFNPLKDGLIRILKSAEDGAIEGVEFEITSSLGETWTVLTNEYGVAELGGLDVYENGEYIEYTITEVNVPIRYQEHQLAWTLTFEEQVSTATILDECFIQSISVENELKTSDLLVRKTSDDGVIEGFTFSVTASNGGSYEITTDSSGQGVLMNLPIYDVNNNLIVYTINEVLPPEMVQYVLPAPVEVTLLYEDLVVVEMHNAFKRITLDITKINDKGDVLAGAKFALLYSTDEGGTWLPLTTDVVDFASDQHVEGNIFVSDKNGKIVIESLYAHYHYKVTEIKAPDGYMLSSSPWIVAPDLTDIEDTKTFENTATNYPQPTLPPTGDAGFGYISIAVLVMCLAGWLGFSKRKKVLN